MEETTNTNPSTNTTPHAPQARHAVRGEPVIKWSTLQHAERLVIAQAGWDVDHVIRRALEHLESVLEIERAAMEAQHA